MGTGTAILFAAIIGLGVLAIYIAKQHENIR